MISIQASLGEVVDKISILTIKYKKLKNADALANVSLELDFLKTALVDAKMEAAVNHALFKDLSDINAALWQVEDDLRALEAKETFDTTFIALARSVYQLNDRRASIKREINLLFDSKLIEEKSYHTY